MFQRILTRVGKYSQCNEEDKTMGNDKSFIKYYVNYLYTTVMYIYIKRIEKIYEYFNSDYTRWWWHCS